MTNTFKEDLIQSLKLLDGHDTVTVFHFGPWPIDKQEVFYLTDLTYAFVNTSPILPGHVLVSPRRVVQRFLDLSKEEASDLIHAAQNVARVLERMHDTCALTISMQDGEEAGQTVPHVHLHVIPRRKNDFKKNDQIYDELDKHDSSRNVKPDSEKDIQRARRSREEMYDECKNIISFMRDTLEKGAQKEKQPNQEQWDSCMQ